MNAPQKFQQKLLRWFADEKRDLPWRRTYTPYHVWVSEIMLQQTQMERGVAYFERWMERFPDIASVAEAGEDEILSLWEGLGYYSRARNLHRAAKLIVGNCGGEFPDTHEAILALPGIGPYTAGAIMSIAFNSPSPIVDANVERVFARVCDIDTPVKRNPARERIWGLAEKLIPQGHARDFNQALMELGALVCLPKKPRCSACPVVDQCEAHRLDIVLERPVPARAVEYIPLEVATGVLVHEGKIYIQKRPETGVWANLWEFPGGSIESGETPEEAIAREYMEETEFGIGDIEKIRIVRHGYTKYRVSLHCFYCALENGRTEPVLHAAQEYRWISPEELDNYAFPAGHRKLIDFMKRDMRFAMRLETSQAKE